MNTKEYETGSEFMNQGKRTNELQIGIADIQWRQARVRRAIMLADYLIKWQAYGIQQDSSFIEKGPGSFQMYILHR